MLKRNPSLSIARPNFFVLGVPKCGTTTLHQVLMAHPHIFMTKEKEPHFFDRDTYYNRGLDRYLRDHFRGAAGFKARGEASSYLASGRKAGDRIRRDLGKDLRFVVILRDPVKRAWSHYLHQCRHGVETESFERALELEPTRLSAGKPAFTAYFRDGLYAHQLRAWFEAFPREHFLVLLTEDLAERPGAVARQAFAFLDVDSDVELSTPSRANVRGASRHPRLAAALNRPCPAILKHLVPHSRRRRMRNLINRWNWRPFDKAPILDPAIARALRRRYYGEILTLEEIIGRDLGMWRSDDYTARFPQASVPRGQRD
jgi:Sulfotransferase domain